MNALQEWCVEARRLSERGATTVRLEVDGCVVERNGAPETVVRAVSIGRKFTVPDEALDDLRYAVTDQTDQTNQFQPPQED